MLSKLALFKISKHTASSLKWYFYLLFEIFIPTYNIHTPLLPTLFFEWRTHFILETELSNNGIPEVGRCNRRKGKQAFALTFSPKHLPTYS